MAIRDRLRNISRTHGLEASVHGIPKIAQAKSKSPKIFWSIISICCICAIGYSIGNIVVNYLQKPKTLDINIITASDDIKFPDVTVCNKFPFDVERWLILNEGVFEYINNGNNATVKTDPQHKSLHQLMKSEFSLDNVMEKEKQFREYHLESLVKEYLGYQTKRNVIQRYVRESVKDERIRSDKIRHLNQWSSLVLSLKEEFIKAFGNRQKTFIADCLYDNMKCKIGAVKNHRDVDYLNCYTFSDITMDMKSKHPIRPGQENGLWLTLFLGDPGYVNVGKHVDINLPYNPLNGGFGARIAIHTPGSVAHPKANGFDVAPGHQSNVDLKIQRTSRVNAPYGMCMESDTKEHNEYTRHSCIQKCMSDVFLEKCGCVPSDVMPNVDFKNWNVTYCDEITSDPITWSNRSDCQLGIRSMFSRNDILEEKCQCFEPCEDIEYDFRLSTSQWPSPYEIDSLLQSDMMRKYTTKKQNIAYWKNGGFAKNFVRLNVHLASNRIKHVTERPVYELHALLGTIGGNLALFMGMSVITLIQGFVYLSACACALCGRDNDDDEDETYEKV